MRTQSLFVVPLLLFAVVGCGGKPKKETTAALVVGAILPLSGPESERGTQVLAGMKLAFAVGPSEPAVEVRAFDVEDSPTLAARRLESLALDPQVVAVVTGWSAATGRSLVADTRRADLPLILLSPLAFPRFDLADPRVIPLHRLESLGAAAARFVREDLRAQRAGIVHDPSLESSRALERAFAETFAAEGGDIIWRVSPQDLSAAPLRTNRSPNRPSAHPDSGSLADTSGARTTSIAFIAAPSAFFESLVETRELEAGALVFPEGWAPPSNDLPAFPDTPGYVMSFASAGDPDPPAREFRVACEREGLRPTDGVAFGWDASCLIRGAIAEGAQTREQVLAQIEARGAQDGATGRVPAMRRESGETPAVSSLTPSGWAFRRRVPTRP